MANFVSRRASRENKLSIACRNGDLSKVRKIILIHKIDVNTTYKNFKVFCIIHNLKPSNPIFNETLLKVTPLHIACLHNHVDVVKFLIQNGANLNPKDFWNATPLHYAASAGNLEVVDYLCQIGVDMDVASACACKKTPVDYANGHKQFDTADLINKHKIRAIFWKKNVTTGFLPLS